MVQFSKLRLNGFKSFVEKTELDIGSGLTGIVGPNGCGKSNLVEALRWVMGENSAKRMRGGGMEDVIFSGTSRRPARNFAEVGIVLNNSSRQAPPPYNTSDEIEIVRRIERDQGSAYKINGRNVRARDVQLLFADTMTGANSPALVSQGRITSIINAKPAERRTILEESAGIAGLYARRHEAELRLRAAENNLHRLDDLIGSQENQLNTLKRQARQAARYKNLSAEIKELDLLISMIEWAQAYKNLHASKNLFQQYEHLVGEKMATVTQLTKTQATQSKDIPALREREASLAATLQTQKLALQRLEDDESHTYAQIKSLQEQIAQITADEDHETSSRAENVQALEKLEREETTLKATTDDDKGRQVKLENEKAEADQLVASLEDEYQKRVQENADKQARYKTLRNRREDLSGRLQSLDAKRESLESSLKEGRDKKSALADTDAIRKHIEELQSREQELRERLEAENETLKSVDEDIEAARSGLRIQEDRLRQCDIEIQTLESFIQSQSTDECKPLINSLTVESGFETALARAMGDTLQASLEQEANHRWCDTALNNTYISPPSWPEGVYPLAPRIQAPDILGPALSFIGYVENDAIGAGAARSLYPGQCVVSLSGGFWRWDGLHVRAEAGDKNTILLEHKNRLSELVQEHPGLASQVDKARARLDTLLSQKNEKETSFQALQKEIEICRKESEEQRRQYQREVDNQSEINTRIARLEESLESVQQDKHDAQNDLAGVEEALRPFQDNALPDQGEEQLRSCREKLNAARADQGEALQALEHYRLEKNRKQARMHAISDERVNLQNRAIRAKEHLKTLAERRAQAHARLEDLNAKPEALDTQKQDLLESIEDTQKQRDQAAEKLGMAEVELEEVNKALKSAENALSEARESRAHARATADAAQKQIDAIEHSIFEHFGAPPNELISKTGKSFQDLQDETADHLRQRRDKNIRDRDAIGPVNLRAEIEADEIENELGLRLSERNDLTQAIDELRGGIQKLNKEARERLLIAFDHVNSHFRSLFTQLFGGGQAYLALIESDDPLGAGLEIYAQPPGKSLQSLSLLSGGEQTLSSIALIFAMFLTNPSPICVLDEIDAPLDDANVDKVCELLEQIAEKGLTRFLIITHHRLTMARMDRLYGVTMAEQGVSQLVSVDLQQQLDFMEAAE